jgi:hypothetical protein
MRPNRIVLRSCKFALVFGCVCAGGCSRRPARVPTPSIDARAAGQAAVKKLDADGDGGVADAELKQSPALMQKRKEIDLDHDGCLTADEIEQRIQAWQRTRVGFITGYKCRVLLDGKPMAGASIQLVPEDFLDGAVKAASGTVDSAGIAPLAIAPDELPEDLRGLNGVQFGMYRVKITHPTRSLPERYVSGAELGCEVFPIGDPEFLTYNVRLK